MICVHVEEITMYVEMKTFTFLSTPNKAYMFTVIIILLKMYLNKKTLDFYTQIKK